MDHNQVSDLLASPYFAALGVPLLLVLVGAAARKLVRGTPWVQRDFYLGIDLALAAFASGLIYIYDVVQLMERDGAHLPSEYADALLAGMSFIVVSMVTFVLMLGLDQDEDRTSFRGVRQFFWLGIVGNATAGGLLTVFILLVKGVAAP
jgi:hypothetical protein